MGTGKDFGMNFGMTGETVESSVAELEKILVENVQGYP